MTGAGTAPWNHEIGLEMGAITGGNRLIETWVPDSTTLDYAVVCVWVVLQISCWSLIPIVRY
jgi:hypothetical protein